MRVEGIRTIEGPNVYSHKPVLVMKLCLEELYEKESFEIPGFIDRLAALLPGLQEHHCALGRPGGFMERLAEGTYFGHIVEHVALELTEPAGIPAYHGKTRETDPPGCYNVIVEYKAEQAARFLLQEAVRLVDALVKGEPFALDETIDEAKRLVEHSELGPSTRSIVEAAERRAIPWVRLNDESLVQLGYGKHRKYIQAAMSENTSAIGMEIAGDKDLTKRLLARSSVPVPRGRIVQTADEAVAALEEIGAPVVVKPLNGRQGKGVSLNLSTPEEVVYAFQIAREFSPDILVEELFKGRNYRVLVVNGKVVAASERIPCHITGDGKHTVEELIDIENRNPLRGDGHERPLTKIRVDPILMAFMQKEGIGMKDVPAAGQMVMLCAGINLSTGGTSKDVTDVIHPEVARLSERAARIVGLDICGVDLVVEDIAAPLAEGGGIIELNAAPGLRMHHFPSEGEPRYAGDAIVNMLFPSGATGRVPIISITGTNGKTTVTRMIAHAFTQAGKIVGMTTTDGIWIGGAAVARGDMTGPHSARTILSDPSVEVAVLETARGGIVRRGLGYDWSDVSVITNIQPDHIGQDGIKSVEDLLFIKSLIAERVREGGTLILNADDERLVALAAAPRIKKIEKQMVYFSLRPASDFIEKHLSAGGTAYLVIDGWIVEAARGLQRRIIRASAIPATIAGTAEFQVANALAAVAACRACGMDEEIVAASFAAFRNEGENSGRVNLYKAARGYVLIDYGHNPEAFKAICRMAASWSGRRVTGVIGVPGDRSDSIIEEAGKVAARGFHRIIIREDVDLRGRSQGEVAGMLCRIIKEEMPDRECSVVLGEVESLTKAIEEMQEGEVVVFFYDDIDIVQSVLARYDAAPVSNIEEVARSLIAARD